MNSRKERRIEANQKASLHLEKITLIDGPKVNRSSRNKTPAEKGSTILKKNQISRKQRSTLSSSSSEDDPVQLVSTDDEDSADEECIFCFQPYKQDNSGEQWIRCS